MAFFREMGESDEKEGRREGERVVENRLFRHIYDYGTHPMTKSSDSIIDDVLTTTTLIQMCTTYYTNVFMKRIKLFSTTYCFFGSNMTC